jgi:hypothetical protein
VTTGRKKRYRRQRQIDRAVLRVCLDHYDLVYGQVSWSERMCPIVEVATETQPPGQPGAGMRR